jgi:hypothetical protein
MASRPVHSRSTAFRRFAAGGAALALALSLAGITAATSGGGASSSRTIFMPTVGHARGGRHGPPGGGGTKTVNLLYNGGSVEVTPTVYLIYWDWAGTNPDAESYVNDFFGVVGGSGWANIDTQYCEGTTTGAQTCTTGTNITNNGGQVAKVITDDSNPVPTKPTQSQIAAEAVKYANQYDNLANATYIVLTPTGHSMRGFGTSWCAWHSAASSSNGNVAYAYVPYQPDAGAACGQSFVNSGSSGIYDGYSIVAGHEYAEAVTDPYPGLGWLDSSGSEIGDKCAWNSATSNQLLNGGTYPVQPLWSNAANSGKGGCVLSY